MAIPNIFQTGKSGMDTAKSQIATSSHNITNANTEGYTRQRGIQEAVAPSSSLGRNFSQTNIGNGSRIARQERVNDSYIEKQVRNGSRELSALGEKQLLLQQVEGVFNEMGGEGLNKLISNFFNDFRKLSADPASEAIRQTVRESSLAMTNDFKRIRNQVQDVERFVDSRLEGSVKEINVRAEEIKSLNIKIRQQEVLGNEANDLKDKRDLALKVLNDNLPVDMHLDKDGMYQVAIRGVGPLVSGSEVEKLTLERTPKGPDGKGENTFSLKTTASTGSDITHVIKGGKIGALIETRDQAIHQMVSRLDELAYMVNQSVNAVHSQGFNALGVRGVNYFNPLTSREGAASALNLSDEVKSNPGSIAAASLPNASGDNRIALAISNLQNMKMFGNGQATLDDFYNSIIADVGIQSQSVSNSIDQQKDIQTNLQKIRESISGVSIDEETANLLQYQHSFDAAARVIRVADECLETVLNLRRL